MRLKDFTCLNPPASHSFEGNAVHVVTGNETDFWRETFYDFRRDSGHFLYTPITSDFTAEVTVDGRYEALYDQAGLMIRLSESNWIKAGVEYTDGDPYFSTVVTNDTSDWSLTGIRVGDGGVRIRVTKNGEAIRVQVLDIADRRWKPARLAYFPPAASAEVGIMCSSPKRGGFRVTFRDFTIGAPISRELHD